MYILYILTKTINGWGNLSYKYQILLLKIEIKNLDF